MSVKLQFELGDHILEYVVERYQDQSIDHDRFHGWIDGQEIPGWFFSKGSLIAQAQFYIRYPEELKP